MKRIGIVGGGQLAMMLIDACREAGAACWVLDPDPDCPAVQAGATWVEGDSWNLAALRNLAAVVDVITVEIEHVDVDNLTDVESGGTPVVPGCRVLRRLVNKHTQKQILSEAGVPTSAFQDVPAGTDIDVAPYGLPLVWKASRGGYDGRGVVVIEDASSLPFRPETDGYIEAFVDARMEVAVMVAVSQAGEMATWTTVEMDFNPETNMLQHLIAPARVDSDIEQRARQLACDAITALDAANEGGGIFGVEMFVAKNGELLVNEIAPRTHNSGHFSMDAAETSQFEQQYRILAGEPLQSTALTAPAAMVNLLGAPGYSGDTVVERLDEVRQIPGASVHLYGKRQCFPHRKMGHGTVTASTIEEAITLAEQVQSTLIIRGAHKDG